MMLPAGLNAAPAAASSVSPVNVGDSPPGNSSTGKLDFRALQNLLAALLAEWGLAQASSNGAAPTANTNASAASNSPAPAPGTTSTPPATGLAPGSKAGAPPALNEAAASTQVVSVPFQTLPQVATVAAGAKASPPSQSADGANVQPLVQASGEVALPSAGAATGTLTGPDIAAAIPGGEPSAGNPNAPVSNQAGTASAANSWIHVQLPDAAKGSIPVRWVVDSGALSAAGSPPGSAPGSVLGAPVSADPPVSTPPITAAFGLAGNEQVVSGSVTAASALAFPGGENQGFGKPKAGASGYSALNADGPATSWTSGATMPVSRQSAGAGEQLGNEIVARMQQTDAGGRTDFHFQLQPPELGSVRVHLSAADGQVSARLVVRDDSTRQLLQSQMDTLLQRLSQAGVALGRFDVSQEGAGFKEQWKDAGGPSNAGRSAVSSQRSAVTARPLPSAGVIDVVA